MENTKTVNIEDHRLNINYDGKIEISQGASRKASSWRNKELNWSALLGRLKNTRVTEETLSEYLRMSKAKQDEIKDIGGFVGGRLKGGKRTADSVEYRQLITLDADFAPTDIVQQVWDMCNYAFCIYSTHKHSPDSPRVRLVIPLKRKLTSEEYEAVSRKIADYIGIEWFDDTTYQPNRLMYWPSTPRDINYVFEYQDAEWLDPDEILAEYEDWTDRSSWPYSSRLQKEIYSKATKQANPLEKQGLVGAFCKAYDIHEAMGTFLSDIYERCDMNDRYTYIEGSTSAGVITYNDTFAYSNHATDPASCKLCNSFDLVRIHKFGHLDEDAKDNTPAHRLESYKAMIGFAKDDSKVKVESLKAMSEDFASDEEADTSWMESLEIDKKGNVLSTIPNIKIILANDPRLKNKFGRNIFKDADAVKEDLPWRDISEGLLWKDSDDSNLRGWLEQEYSITGVQKIDDAFTIVGSQNKFHPVRDYLDSLEWDGELRLDSLLIDYLGAEDNIYVRAATRKIFTAAVARIYVPGTKFDTMLVITGKQGQGKSTLLKKMGKGWFNDSIKDLKNKDAYELLLGSWIIEMSELEALKKAEVEQIKMFLSKTEDIHRLSYGKRSGEYKRQCVFFGTTNEDDFLKDRTGNRRFWPIKAIKGKSTKSPFEHLEDEVDQIWAEAKHRYQEGEKLYLEGELEELAIKEQKEHMVEDHRIGMIEDFLNKEVPKNWAKMDLDERRLFLSGGTAFINTDEMILRNEICALEVWCELFNGDISGRGGREVKEINKIIKNIEGWEPLSSPRKFGCSYGSQRGFRRVEKTNLEEG